MPDATSRAAAAIALPARPALIKVAVPRARAMLLTDTFQAAGRSAMILDEERSSSLSLLVRDARAEPRQKTGVIRGK